MYLADLVTPVGPSLGARPSDWFLAVSEGDLSAARAQ